MGVGLWYARYCVKQGSCISKEQSLLPLFILVVEAGMTVHGELWSVGEVSANKNQMGERGQEAKEQTFLVYYVVNSTAARRRWSLY